MSWSLGTCEGCGSEVRVEAEFVTDGDRHQCEDCECVYQAMVSAEDHAYIVGDDPVLECRPCRFEREDA
jgi:hypothetical protein